MALNKVTYVGKVTRITAANLNDIQDEIIDIRTGYDGTTYPTAGDAVRGQIEEAMESGGSSVPTAVRSAILTLFEAGAYAETGLTDEIAIIQSWATEVTSLTVSPTTLSLNGSTPQTIVATVVPSSASVTWSSSDTTIATVVGGVVTGVSNGTCTITASAGDKSATCAVTVSGFAELVSISAVYTQSGYVYENTSLDDLKADLVVTATYSDSSTAVVTNYTLSGTLTEGTSTITVAYGGKTTTFTVTVSQSREERFGTFEAGAIGKGTSGTNARYLWKTVASARARMPVPILNSGYVFTVTDSTKYQLAAYDPESLQTYQKTVSGIGTVDAYYGGTKSIAWVTSDSVTTDYVWLALKKLDNTDFTAEELANGAEAVFTFTES